MSSANHRPRGHQLLSIWNLTAVLCCLVPDAFAQDVAVSLEGGVRYPDGSVQTAAVPGVAPVADSGQTSCWDATGTERDCAGTGEDGEHLAGLSIVTPRFTDNTDGTVSDSQTGLMWLKDADCGWGLLPWEEALEIATDFNAGSGPAGGDCAEYDDDVPPHTDWRLPSLAELRSLVHFGTPSPTLPPDHPFLDVGFEYWTSTTKASSTNAAWSIRLDVGGHVSANKITTIRAWLVRGLPSPGSIQTSGAVLTLADGGLGFADGSLQQQAARDLAPLRATGWTTCFDTSGGGRNCAGTGEDGEFQIGVAAPSPRFEDLGDGTVLDNLTGLVWLKHANCPAVNKTWQQALDWVDDLNTMSIACTGYAAGTYNDWRLPNAREFFSLNDFTESTPALPSIHPFIDFLSAFDQHYWTSTTIIATKDQAYAADMGDGLQRSKGKTDTGCCWVWPVRGGNISQSESSTQTAALALDAGGIEFPDGSVQTSALTYRAAVGRTGQSDCYATDGMPRACADTGEDGDHQAGVGWPSPRFIDHGDGTVTDELTGLMWLKDTDCAEPDFISWGEWQDMMDWVDDFNGGSTGCTYYAAGTYDDWRMPSMRELASVIDYSQQNPPLPAGHPFVNTPWNTDVNNSFQWASSTADPETPPASFFWVVSSRDGEIDKANFAPSFGGAQAVWPVRGLSLGPARVADTGLRADDCYAPGGTSTPCPGTGQDAELQAGVAWPTPRFLDNEDGTITDELTGLTWLKDMDCLNGDSWQQTLDAVATLNTTSVACTEYAPQTYTDWRLPNIKELHSLGDFSALNFREQEHPFITTSGFACSSTSFVGDPTQFWYWGEVVRHNASKDTPGCNAWPVRGGSD